MHMMAGIPKTRKAQLERQYEIEKELEKIDDNPTSREWRTIQRLRQEWAAIEVGPVL